jgi:K+-sensing histidine kinase KdpD
MVDPAAVLYRRRQLARERRKAILAMRFDFSGIVCVLGVVFCLSLTRRIVEQHHGRIEVTSEIGKGTRFEVYLPLKDTALSAVS